MNHHYLYSASVMNADPFALPAGRFHAKDPWSALTHFMGFLYAIFLTPVLLIHASMNGAPMSALVSLSIFMLSMIMLFGASAAYHTFLLQPPKERILKKVDHCMIFVLIAGSYTPICTNILPLTRGLPLLMVVWGLAIAGIAFKLLWVTCPRWVSSVIYIGMGWSCLSVFPQLIEILSTKAFMLLLGGGLVYTIGGVLYALKLKKLNTLSPVFGSHEIFHVCVMIGTLMHFAFMFVAV